MAEILVLNPAGLAEVLRGPSGPVYQDTVRRTTKVHAKAVELCPVDTGALRSSLRWVIAEDSRGIFGVVGTDKVYAEWASENAIDPDKRHYLERALQEAQ